MKRIILKLNDYAREAICIVGDDIYFVVKDDNKRCWYIDPTKTVQAEIPNAVPPVYSEEETLRKELEEAARDREEYRQWWLDANKKIEAMENKLKQYEQEDDR